jgi:hypothetical protein
VLLKYFVTYKEQKMDISYYGMILITGCVIVLGVYEMFAVFFFKNKSSFISTIMQRAGFRAPFIAFAFGFLSGHFWGYFPPEPEIIIKYVDINGNEIKSIYPEQIIKSK